MATDTKLMTKLVSNMMLESNTVSNWVSQASSLPCVQSANAKARNELNGVAWPARNHEYWKYTSLKHIEQGEFDFSPVSEQATVELSEVSIDNLDSVNLVFVDGVYRADLSNLDAQAGTLSKGLNVVDFADANEDQQTVINDKLHSTVRGKQHMLAHLNGAMLQHGVLITVAPNVQIEKPVHITHHSTKQSHQKGIQHRVLIHLEHRSEMTLVESFSNDTSEHTCWVNQVTEVIQDAESKVQHYRLHQELNNLTHTGSIHVTLQRNAQFNSFMLGYGSKLKRVDYTVFHEGEGGDCNLQGVFLVNQKQHFDLRTLIEHTVPHCETDEVFRGIIDDSASAVFNGKIRIHKDAQKTLAEMSNRNLLLSEDAKINTKPELEIYADDVKCAHGATISQMDPDALSYLRCRGISMDEANIMLSFGFINEVLQMIEHPEILEHIRPSIVQKFGQDETLLRHIS